MLTQLISWFRCLEMLRCTPSLVNQFLMLFMFFSTDSPTNVGPSSWREEDSDKLLWIILSAVLGVLLIVSIVVVIVCYRRLKKTRRDQGG